MHRTLITVVLVIAYATGCASLFREHEEARNVIIAAIDFSTLKAGRYKGSYAGGMKSWRANSVAVAVAGGRVTEINLLYSAEFKKPGHPDYAGLVNRILEAQSLQVDGITAATLTTKAHLKAIENALLKAAPEPPEPDAP